MWRHHFHHFKINLWGISRAYSYYSSFVQHNSQKLWTKSIEDLYFSCSLVWRALILVWNNMKIRNKCKWPTLLYSQVTYSTAQTRQDHHLRPDQPDQWFWLITRIIMNINAESKLLTCCFVVTIINLVLRLLTSMHMSRVITMLRRHQWLALYDFSRTFYGDERGRGRVWPCCQSKLWGNWWCCLG